LASTLDKIQDKWDLLIAHAHRRPNLETAAQTLTDAIQHAIQQAAPIIKRAPQAKVWWNEDIKEKRRIMKSTYRDWKGDREEVNWNFFTEARNTYFRSIRQAKTESWTKFLEDAQGKDAFQVLRFTKPRHTEKTPTIAREGNPPAHSFEEKCQVFRESM